MQDLYGMPAIQGLGSPYWYASRAGVFINTLEKGLGDRFKRTMAAYFKETW